ncbi:hypothetical protein C1T31_12125 [Hanstruepera neustonica]|uniref:Uncharacterized protein n=1 Tax=Hanstruepera neustonica TaxID=1445657 RepID=A0A2K1DW84_9FLAO|nr:hypothetical protein [Hanstruepera neustonica]PNQ72295.1 hypothetical protein C1T31_12125 [Hanstruepera neustonica]
MKGNIINYFLILVGAIVAIYAQANEKQSTAILILGIAMLMFGVYRIARTIPSKNDKDNDHIDRE